MYDMMEGKMGAVDDHVWLELQRLSHTHIMTDQKMPILA